MSKIEVTPICTQCGHKINFVGNEVYADNGNKYIYHCPYCGADIETYEPLDEDKSSYSYWKER